MKSRFLIIGLLALVLAATAANELLRDRRVSRNLDKIVPGTTEASVVTLLGPPSSEKSCDSSYAVSNVPGCSRVLVYRGAFAPVVPAWESVYLDQSGKVIKAEEYSSP